MQALQYNDVGELHHISNASLAQYIGDALNRSKAAIEISAGAFEGDDCWPCPVVLPVLCCSPNIMFDSWLRIAIA